MTVVTQLHWVHKYTSSMKNQLLIYIYIGTKANRMLLVAQACRSILLPPQQGWPSANWLGGLQNWVQTINKCPFLAAVQRNSSKSERYIRHGGKCMGVIANLHAWDEKNQPETFGISTAESGIDLHEPLQCSSNDHSLQQPRETCHHCALSYHIQGKIMCWFGGWPLMIPIQALEGNFDLPDRQKVALKRNKTTQFRPSIHRNHRIMLSDLRLGTYRPGGSLAIVNLALIGTPIEKTILP